MSQRTQGSILDSLGLGGRTTRLGTGLGRTSSNMSNISSMPTKRGTLLGRVRTTLFGANKTKGTVDHLFMDEQNLYKKDMQKLLKYLDMAAGEEINMTTAEIAESIEKFGRIAHLGGPSTMKYGLEIVPLVLNLIQSPDNAPRLIKAALSCLSLLTQSHTENQNYLLDREVDDVLVRLMATGGYTNEPVLQMWATYW